MRQRRRREKDWKTHKEKRREKENLEIVKLKKIWLVELNPL